MATTPQQGINKDGSASARPDDGVSDLMADHRKVEDLFKQFENAGDNAQKKQRLVAQITKELRVHMAIEEEIFYPTSRDFVEADMVNEAEVEHQGAKTLMEELEGMSPEDEYYDAKVKVLQEQIEHHVEEEETEYFPACRKSEMDLKSVGDRMEARRAELTAQG